MDKNGIKAYALHFVLPSGQEGASGLTGVQGPTGPMGPVGLEANFFSVYQ